MNPNEFRKDLQSFRPLKMEMFRIIYYLMELRKFIVNSTYLIHQAISGIHKHVRRYSSNEVYNSQIQNRTFSTFVHGKNDVQSFGNFSLGSSQR